MPIFIARARACELKNVVFFGILAELETYITDFIYGSHYKRHLGFLKMLKCEKITHPRKFQVREKKL